MRWMSNVLNVKYALDVKCVKCKISVGSKICFSCTLCVKCKIYVGC